MNKIHTLTGLRGLAALIVFISHAANESLLPSYFGNGFGHVGVMIFFLLSGFLMAYLYIHEEFNYQHVKKYALARIGRVFPLYYALLLTSILITHYSNPEYFPYKFDDLRHITRALLLVDAKYVFWTIPVEIQFYVVFIGFWWLYKKGLRKSYLGLFVILTMLPSIAVYSISSELPAVISTYSYAFFIGVVTALLFDKIKQQQHITKASSILGLPTLLLLFINLPDLRSQLGLELINDDLLRIWGDPVNWLVVYALFICAALNSPGLAILNRAFFVYLGNISYGFYLIHYPVLMFFVHKTDANHYAKFIAAFLVTVTLSSLSFYYYEKPVGKIIRNS